MEYYDINSIFFIFFFVLSKKRTFKGLFYVIIEFCKFKISIFLKKCYNLFFHNYQK